MTICFKCGGTGWRSATNATGYSHAAVCDCPAGLAVRARNQKIYDRNAETKKHPGGFTHIADCGLPPRPGRGPGIADLRTETIAEILKRRPALKGVITPVDVQIAEVIERHTGEVRAITAREIAGVLWPGTTMLLDQAEKYRRAVTESVERLRTLARMPIAASKKPPYGYFMPETAVEATEMHDRLLGEGVKLIQRSQLFRVDRDLVRQLEGQLGFEESGDRSQETECPANTY
jgi:hypothetical protein